MTERGALVTTWGAGRAGTSPGKGMEVFGKALSLYDELAKEGRITGYRVYASTNRDAGMLVAEGDATELARITTEPQSTTLLALAAAVVDDVRIEVCIGGSPDDVVGFYTRAIDAMNEVGLAD